MRMSRLISLVALATAIGTSAARSDDYCKAALQKVEQIHSWLGVKPVPPNTPLYEKVDAVFLETRDLGKSIATLAKGRSVYISVQPGAKQKHLVDCSIHRKGSPGHSDCTNATNVNSALEPILKAMAVAYCSTNLGMQNAKDIAYWSNESGVIGGRDLFISALVCAD